MFISTHGRGRRHRKDLVARNTALTITFAVFLLALGGMWFLGKPFASIGVGSWEPLIVMETKSSDVLSRPRNSITSSSRNVPVERGVAMAEIEQRPTQISGTTQGPTFNGRPLRKVKTLRMLVTGYSPDARSCGKFADNITASGYSVWTNGMKSVAADRGVLPFGAIVSVPGYDNGQPVPVLDRGGAIKGMRLDLLYPTHEVARQWGKKWVNVTVWDYAD